MADEPEAKATPDLDTVMAENAELRVALAHYLGDQDIDEVLDAGISTSRSGEVRFTPPASEGDEPDGEGDSDASAGKSTEPAPSTSGKPKPAKRPAARQPGTKATGSKTAADPFKTDPKALASGSDEQAFFEAAGKVLFDGAAAQ